MRGDASATRKHMQDRRQSDGDCEAMTMARCSICQRFYTPQRSRTMCDPDYWRVRRLRQKEAWELDALDRDADLVKARIAAARHSPDDTDGTVAPTQRRSR